MRPPTAGQAETSGGIAGMTKRILERYARTNDGRVIIDIAAGRIADLYDDFDRHAPYLKKELDQGLVEYLIDSVREIRREPFLIQFSLSDPVDSPALERVKTSLQNYFLYLKELEARELRRLLRGSLILLIIGIAILTASVLVNGRPAVREVLLGKVIAEGLTIAAWISLWEALARFLLKWPPHRWMIRMYERIATADVQVHDVPHQEEL